MYLLMIVGGPRLGAMQNGAGWFGRRIAPHIHARFDCGVVGSMGMAALLVYFSNSSAGGRSRVKKQGRRASGTKFQSGEIAMRLGQCRQNDVEVSVSFSISFVGKVHFSLEYDIVGSTVEPE